MSQSSRTWNCVTVRGCRISRVRSFGFLAPLLFLLPVGCGLESERSGDGSRLLEIAGPVSQSVEYSASIGSAGGALGGEDAWFAVPPNALSATTTITMVVSPVNSPGNLLEAEMGPDGQTFSIACTLSIRKPSGYDLNDVYHIALWDEENSEWDDQGGTDQGSYVSLAVSHFSRYRIVVEADE